MAEDAQKHPKDMSIDELSAAIDAHVADIGVKKKPTTKPVAEPNKQEEPEAEASLATKERETDSEITISHTGYISKPAVSAEPEASSTTENPDEELIASSKKVITPLTPATSKETPDKIPQPAKAPSRAAKIDMMFKQQAPTKKKEPAPAAKPVARTETQKPGTIKEETKPKLATTEKDKKEKSEPVEKPAEEPKAVDADKAEDENPTKKESQPAAEVADKKAEKAPEQSENYIDKLARQIETKEDREKIAKEAEKKKQDALSKDEDFLFDSKQYHIPIKAKNHRRRGNAINVFLALLAATLAILYVLNELEIINLVDYVLPE